MRIILLILAVMTCFPAAATAGDEEATPLHEASENGRADGVKRLLAAGADVNAKDRDGRTLTESKVVETFWGGDVNAKDISGVTPLQYAIHKSHADVVELLLKAARGKE